MKEKNNWEEISGDISNVAKRIKSKIDEEDLVDDLKDSLKNTIENTADVVKALIKTINSTVKDDELKEETIKSVETSDFHIEIAGTMAKAKISSKPLYDPISEKIRM